MYKIMILFPSEIAWPIFTKFHIETNVETGLRVCSNGHTPSTVMPIYDKMIIKNMFFFKTRNCSNMILSVLVAMTELGNCCIKSADLQWLFHSGE